MVADLVAARANVFFAPTGTIVIADVLASPADGKMFIVCGSQRYMVMWSQSALCEFRTY